MWRGKLTKTLERSGAAVMNLSCAGFQHQQLQRRMHILAHQQRTLPSPSMSSAAGGQIGGEARGISARHDDMAQCRHIDCRDRIRLTDIHDTEAR